MIETIKKPWGFEETLASLDEPTITKVMNFDKDVRNSLHYHTKKREIVYCIAGAGMLQRDTEMLRLIPGAYYTIDKRVAHRIKTFTELKILEISVGEYDINDIIRIEDDYGRN
jgi:mannose-6-phosphate isomerase-like protein (cupin superfamily)